MDKITIYLKIAGIVVLELIALALFWPSAIIIPTLYLLYKKLEKK